MRAWQKAALFAVCFGTMVAGGLLIKNSQIPDPQDTWSALCESYSVGTEYFVSQRNINGKTMCVKLRIADNYPVWDYDEWQRGCKELGGEVHNSHRDKACYVIEVVEGLGPKEDYQE